MVSLLCPTTISLIDLLDRILDQGIVIYDESGLPRKIIGRNVDRPAFTSSRRRISIEEWIERFERSSWDARTEYIN
jgi:hypothetical protein